MPNKRDYLVSKGLAKPGRGRFSREAVAALERARQQGVVFEGEVRVDSGEPESALPPAAVVRDDPIVRDIKTVTGYTQEGAKVQSGICFRCSKFVGRCACKLGITASPIVARWDKDSEVHGRPIDTLARI